VICWSIGGSRRVDCIVENPGVLLMYPLNKNRYSEESRIAIRIPSIVEYTI
jgi:hypothetical protein